MYKPKYELKMTGYYTEALRESIYRWRINHPEKFKEARKKYGNTYYLKHKARLTSERKFKEEWKRLSNILI